MGRGYAPKDGPPGEICVGFNRGNMSKGIIFVDKPDNIRVNSKESLIVGKTFETIVKASGVAPYDRMANEGFWRILLYRESRDTK